MYTFCLLFSYLIKVVALLYFICCYQHVLVNKDIHYQTFRIALLMSKRTTSWRVPDPEVEQRGPAVTLCHKTVWYLPRHNPCISSPDHYLFSQHMSALLQAALYAENKYYSIGI